PATVPGTGAPAALTFRVIRLPSGTTPTIHPTSVNGSGSPITNVTTGLTTPRRTYQLTITADNGGIVARASVTLVVGPPVMPVPGLKCSAEERMRISRGPVLRRRAACAFVAQD